MTAGNRQLNFELLRIIAMLMILGLHANFTALKAPQTDSIFTIDGLFRIFFEFVCIVAVYVFVMISGWFGIRPSLQGFCNFMWQVIYFVGILWIVGTLFFDIPISLKTALWAFGLYGGGGWFVASYIGLYIISPVLNAYLEQSSSRNIVLMLAAFFAFEFMWGVTLSAEFIVCGYSTFSFIGIYILAGLLRKVHFRYNSALPYFGIFCAANLANALLYVLTLRCGAVAISGMLLYYINPLVIISATCLVLAFAKMPPLKYDRIIKLLASSCFAVYLFHVGVGYALDLYCDGVRWLYNALDGIGALVIIIAYIFIIFLVAVLIDYPRKFIWKHILLPRSRCKSLA